MFSYKLKGAYKIMEVQKLTKQNLEDFKNESDNKLTKFVCDYIINEWDDEHEDDNEKILLDVINYGCANGSVHLLVYTTDVLEFYETYKNEIYDLLVEVLDGCGCNSPADLFGKNWDIYDPLAFYELNKRTLAFFGFEETIRNIANEFGIEW